MTIIASVKVRDGLILGTDSMTQIQASDETGRPNFLKAYSNARKLFQIKNLPIGAMTYGLGNLDQKSIQGLVLEFGDVYKGDDKVKSVADGLFEFINKIYSELWKNVEQKPALGFYLAGYSPHEPFSEEWEFLLPVDKAPKSARPQKEFGASWRGIDIPFSRLYKGYDYRIINELKGAGVSDEILNSLNKWAMPLIFDGMPLQDSINFVSFILNTTISYSTFEIGVPACGGPLQVATILPQTGFSWISQPQLSVNSWH